MFIISNSLGSDKKALPKVVNRRQLFDLYQFVPPSIGSSSTTDELALVPSFLHSNRPDIGLSSNSDNLDSSINFDSAKGTDTPHYNTRARHKATAAVKPVAVETIVTCL